MKRSPLYASFVALLAATSQIHAATYTYIGAGADAKWSTLANWVGGVAPVSQNTTELVFDLTTTNSLNRANTNQDIANPPFKLLTLTYAATDRWSIRINGGALRFDHDIKTLRNDNSRSHSINVGVTLGGGNYPLHFGGAGAASAGGNVKITRIIDGTPGIKVDHAPGGTLELTDANTFGGGVEVVRGQLLVGHNSALGSGMLTISGGAIAASVPGTYRPTNSYQITGDFTVARGGTREGRLDLAGAGTITGVRTVTLDGPKTLSVLIPPDPYPQPNPDGPKKQLFLSGALTAPDTAVLKFVRGPNGTEPTFTADRKRVRQRIPASWVTIGTNGVASPDFQAKIEAVGVVLKIRNTSLGSEAKKLPEVVIGDPMGRQQTAHFGSRMGFFLKNYTLGGYFKIVGGDKTLYELGNSPGTVTINGGGGFYMDALTGLSVSIEGTAPGDNPGQHSQLVMNDNGPIILVHDTDAQTRPVLYTTLGEDYTPDVGDRYKIIDQTSSLAPRLDADDNLFQISTNGAWIVGGSPGDLTLHDGTVFEDGSGVMWMMRYGLLPGEPGATSQDENDVFLTVAGLDCNTNSVPDDQDIAAGTSQDCDFNGVPDECEPDCNGNLVPDACDIAAGTSQDCNADGVPNECDPDCNGNSMPDPCDIAFGASPDCDLNGVPDECDPDCNANGVPDACDIAGLGLPFTLAEWTFQTAPPADLFDSAVSPNVTADAGVFVGASEANGLHASANSDWTTPAGNGSLDSFSVNEWTAGDYWQFRTSTLGYSGITVTWDQARSSTGPATFDLQWSMDGTTFTTLLDDYTVQLNGAPNPPWNGSTRSPIYQLGPVPAPASLNNQPTVYFRLVSQTTPGPAGTNRIDNVRIEGTVASADCNGDGVPDECDADCNANSIADVCDIVSGTSADCNYSGVPDECDIAAGTSSDCNFDGVPDECEMDCNGNGLPDDCEMAGPLSGFALAFDGVDDFVGVPGFGAIAPTTEVTVEFWQKADAVRPQYTLALGPDMSANRLAAAAPWSDGRVYWDFGDTTGPAPGRLSYIPPEPIVGSWQHFAFVASQSGNHMRIYRNGVLEASKAGMDPLAPAGRSLRIGGLPGSFFGGLIDEVRIWNVARTQSQIQSTMNAALSGEEPGLLAYWRFDEGSGMTAADSAGNSDGTLVSGTAWAALYTDENANGLPDECESEGCAGDADGDGDVDLSDYTGFEGCMNGPAGGLGAGCECFDLDVSGDVDLIDFAEFQVLFTGNLVP